MRCTSCIFYIDRKIAKNKGNCTRGYYGRDSLPTKRTKYTTDPVTAISLLIPLFAGLLAEHHNHMVLLTYKPLSTRSSQILCWRTRHVRPLLTRSSQILHNTQECFSSVPSAIDHHKTNKHCEDGVSTSDGKLHLCARWRHKPHLREP